MFDFCQPASQKGWDPFAQPVCHHPIIEQFTRSEDGSTYFFRVTHQREKFLSGFPYLYTLPGTASALDGLTRVVYRITFFINNVVTDWSLKMFLCEAWLTLVMHHTHEPWCLRSVPPSIWSHLDRIMYGRLGMLSQLHPDSHNHTFSYNFCTIIFLPSVIFPHNHKCIILSYWLLPCMHLIDWWENTMQ